MTYLILISAYFESTGPKTNHDAHACRKEVMIAADQIVGHNVTCHLIYTQFL